MTPDNVTGRDPNALFDHRVETLIDKGYPNLAGMSRAEFATAIEPLREQLPALTIDETHGRIPFVIVVKNEVVSAEAAMALISARGKAGYVGMYPVEPGQFSAIDGVRIPGGAAYLLIDVDTGQATLNVTPDDALGMIGSAGRSPLTIDEGIALVTHHPEALTDRAAYNCFSMLASRCGDKRVPALWLSDGKPRLGWCWAGNPHTWLGSASCGARVGVGEQIAVTAE